MSCKRCQRCPQHEEEDKQQKRKDRAIKAYMQKTPTVTAAAITDSLRRVNRFRAFWDQNTGKPIPIEALDPFYVKLFG